MCIRNSTFFLFVCSFISLSSASFHCREGRNDHLDVQVRCPSDQCAIFKNSFLPYKERMCFDEFAAKHPSLLNLACLHSHERALCYNKFSPQRLPDSLIDVEEGTFGEVLTALDIDSFCCCRGNNCNAVNHQMKNYYESDKSYHPHHHRHHQNIHAYPHKEFYPGGESDTGSSSSIKPALITLIVAALFCH